MFSKGHRLLQETSRMAYREIKFDGTRQTCLERVYLFLIGHPKSCNREVAEGTGLQINNVTARVNELRKMMLVDAAGKKVDGKTGKRVLAWSPVPFQAHLPQFTATAASAPICVPKLQRRTEPEQVDGSIGMAIWTIFGEA